VVINSGGSEVISLFRLGTSCGVSGGAGAGAVYQCRKRTGSCIHNPHAYLASLSVCYCFWITRVWDALPIVVRLHDDPVVFAIRDRVSLFVGALFCLVFLGAKHEYQALLVGALTPDLSAKPDTCKLARWVLGARVAICAKRRARLWVHGNGRSYGSSLPGREWMAGCANGQP